MAKLICLLLLALSLTASARILDEVTPPVPLPDTTDDPVPPPATTAADPAVTPVVAPTTTLPGGNQPPATITGAAPVVPTEPAAPVVAPVPDAPDAVVPPVTTPADSGVPGASAGPAATAPANSGTAGATAAATTPANGVAAPGAAAAATIPAGGATGPAAVADGHPALSFFMHDILGGSQPSGRVVTGIVASSDASTLPFSKPNNLIFPVEGGVPLNTINGVVNDNNVPYLVGLDSSGDGGALVQTNGNNVQAGGNQAFVSAGQLPQGVTLQQLIFGSVTVVDNEITEGHELGAAVLGSAQGFYIASSSDGSTHTLVLTALFHSVDHGHEHEIVDTLSFFGIHRTATPVSHIAIIGGTGKYENAKGYATIETLPHVDQHTTDGVETITHFTLFLTP